MIKSIEKKLITLIQDSLAGNAKKNQQKTIVKEVSEMDEDKKVFYQNILDIAGKYQEIKAKEKEAKRISLDDKENQNTEISNTIEELNALNDELNLKNDIISSERKQFLSILNSIPELIYVSDIKTGEILFANKALKETVGRNITGKVCYETLQGKKERCEFCTNKIIIHTTKPYFWEYYNPVLKKHFYIMNRKINWSDDQREVRFELAIDITDKKKAENDLREKSELLKETQRIANLGSWEFDISTQALKWSEETYRIAGIDIRQKITMDNYLNTVYPEDRNKLKSAIEKALVSKNSYEIELRHKKPDGTNNHVITRGKPVLEKGEVKILIGSVQDITQLKKAETALKESEARLEMFFQRSGEGFFFMMLDKPIKWDENTDKEKTLDYVFAHQRITKVNNALLQQYRAKKEDFLGLTPNDLFAHDIEYGKQVWRKFFNQGVLEIDTHEKRMDGENVIITGNYTCLYNKNGEITGHFGTQHDVTEERMAKKALRLSEEKYRFLVEETPDSVFTLNLDGTYSYVNKAFAKTFKKNQDFFINKTFEDVLTPESAKKAFEAFEKAKQSKTTQLIETELLHNNKRLCFLTTIVPVVIDKQVTSIQCSSKNITPLKQAESALKESEAKFRLIAENVSDVIWILDISSWNYTFISPSVFTLRGYTVEEAIQENFFDSMMPEHASKIKKDIEKDIQELPSNPEHFFTQIKLTEFKQYKKNKETVWTETSTRYQRSHNGNIEMIGVSRNIEERKKNEEKIKQRLAYEESIAKCSNALLINQPNALSLGLQNILHGLNISRILFFKNHLKDNQVTQFYPVEEVCSENVKSQIKFLQKTPISKNNDGFVRWEKILSSNNTIHGIVKDFPKAERNFLQKHGIKSILIIPVRVNNKWYGFISFDDIEKERHWQEEDIDLLRTVSEMIGLYIDNENNKEIIISRNKQLDQMNATKDKFFSIVAHDLKNPFNSVITLSELLINNILEFDKKDITKMAETIYSTGKNTYKLLENLLVWSRSQTGKIKFNPEKLLVDNLFNMIIDMYQNNASVKNIKITSHIDNDMIIFADRNMISTIIRNLLNNAIKFTHKNGSVHLSAIRKNGFNMISVKDTGIGMEKQTVSKLFKIHEKVSTPGTENEQGTGIGLFLCKEFAQKHQGDIIVTSEPGKGSDFIFTFPAA